MIVATTAIGVAAVAAVAGWWIVALNWPGPFVYGEGAATHAALLMRIGAEYRSDGISAFAAANYPPLFFLLTSLGEPLLVGRLISIGSALTVAGVLWLGAPVRIAGAWTAAAWLSFGPVTIMSATAKPDLMAVAFTVGAVALLEVGSVLPAGVAIGLAVATKQTALLPAVALAVWLFRTDPRRIGTFVAGGTAVLGGTLLLLAQGGGWSDAWRHIVEWNVLPWNAGQAIGFGFLALITLGVAPWLVVQRRLSGPVAGYLAGAAAILAMSGREGADTNFLIDAAAAVMLLLSRHGAVLIAKKAAVGALIGGGMLAALLWLPLLPAVQSQSVVPSSLGRLDIARRVVAACGDALFEDSGLQIAAGGTPIIDDLFLYSRLVAAGRIPGDLLSNAISARRFQCIVAEADLSDLAHSPQAERERWPTDVTRRILANYTLDRHEGALWVYVPR